MKSDVFSLLPGMLIIGSAPSGAGKNSIFSEVLRLQKGAVQESISCTTRQPRPDEVDGRDYNFVSLERFNKLEQQDLFLEAGGEHDGRRYGTLLEPVVDRLRQGVDVLLIIEVKGARIARSRAPEALTIFIMPAGDSLEEKSAQLESQLRKRGYDSEERIHERLELAVQEIAQASQYQHVVINAPGRLDDAVAEVNSIINNARNERKARLAQA